MLSDKLSGALTDRQQIGVVVLTGLLVGAVLAPVAYSTTDGTTNIVAVVEVDGPIESSLAGNVESELTDIRQNDSVKAVVLKMDTPGGAPAASERMYTAIQRTAQNKTVVASVQGVSASGGYYAMLPTEDIYVLPTSAVGSVGVAAGAPQDSPPERGPSGPDKRGINSIEQWALQQTLADTFINTVMEQRGDEIELSRSQVARANTYLGTEAIQNGFADEIGSIDDAIEGAAEKEGLDEYQVDRRESEQGGLAVLLRTDEQIVAVYSNEPGYAEVKPFGPAYVREESIPHVDTVERFTRSDLAAGGGSAETGSPANPTDGETQPSGGEQP